MDTKGFKKPWISFIRIRVLLQILKRKTLKHVLRYNTKRDNICGDTIYDPKY